MPALLLGQHSGSIVEHATHKLVTLVSRATLGFDEESEFNASRHAMANDEMRKQATGLWAATSVDAAGILASHQRHTIQVVCAVMACISMIAAMCAIYWFCMMRRNYRRDLVLMLILGDFYKDLWYLIHGSVNFGRSQVRSEETFCQVSGYMLQVGLQSCDVAILLISMHMALQIFPPKDSFLGHDGLYKVRRWVFAIWLGLPCFTAALAFANSNGAYQAQGAFCWLPIRPFWYRLALSWVPRYLIWLYIMYVAIRIYSHVGYEFRVFAKEKDRSSSTDLSAESSAERGALEKAVREHRSQLTSTEKTNGDEDWSIPPSEAGKFPPGNANRRMSLPAWRSPFGGALPDDDAAAARISRSNPTSRRGSRQIAPGVVAEDFMAPPGFDSAHPRGSVSSVGSIPRSLTAASIDQPLPPIAETHTNTDAATASSSTASTTLGNRAMRQRRRAIQRQLRILFIYPVVYMLLWLIPFLSHCMSYSDRFAQHPVFAISLMSSFCQSFMGFADVCVFCWRERPWRHIQNSDGTFWGSFNFWAKQPGDDGWARRESRAPSQVPDSEAPQSTTKLLSSFKRWSMSRKNSSPLTSGAAQSPGASRPTLAHKRAFSGTERQFREADMAHERLRMEREDYERNRGSVDKRRESATSPTQAPARKEWFDQNISTEDLDESEPRASGT